MTGQHVCSSGCFETSFEYDHTMGESSASVGSSSPRPENCSGSNKWTFIPILTRPEGNVPSGQTEQGNPLGKLDITRD